MKSLTLTVVVWGAACLSGCCLPDMRYHPLAHRDGWDPMFGSCHQCGTCGGDCEGHTPGSYLGHKITCASGCGDIYWGEWTNNPPDPCDPCDNCGNWTGPRCCPATFWECLLVGLPGGRTHHGKGSVCTGKGCTTCDEHAGAFPGDFGPFPVDGELVAPPMPQPTPAGPPARRAAPAMPPTPAEPALPPPTAPTTPARMNGALNPSSLFRSVRLSR